jgi:hypothetical protein
MRRFPCSGATAVSACTVVGSFSNAGSGNGIEIPEGRTKASSPLVILTRISCAPAVEFDGRGNSTM